MTEKPIIFSGPMIRAILEGRKTQTRRVVKPQPNCGLKPCPWQVGDTLWVRETWADTNGECGPMISYKAGGDRFLADPPSAFDCSKYPGCKFTMWCGDLRRGEPGHSWRSPIHMPRWASRITLEVTGIRAERLNDISEEDARKEGIADGGCRNCGENEPCGCDNPQPDPVDAFIFEWNMINAKRGYDWHTNPWVWVLGFKRVSVASE